MSNEQNDVSRFERFEGPPKGYFVVVPGNSDAQLINVEKVFFIARSSWKLLVATALLAALIAAVITLRMRNVYRAVALIAPVTQGAGGGASSLRNQLGGLAAIAGIDVGEIGARKAESFATLTSTALARQFIADQNMLPILYADRWDASAARWRDGKAPPMDAAVKMLTTSVVIFTENHNTGIVTVAAEWYSAELAAHWANRMIELANDRLRAEATRNGDRRIEYLNRELTKTSVEEMRQAIYRLIEDQVNNAMLANVEREYAYHVIDPAVAPELKFAPRRAVTTGLAGIGGLFLGFVLAYARSSFARNVTKSTHGVVTGG